MKWKDQNLIDRDHFIDILKGICIIFVVITHFAWSDEERLRFLFPFWIDMAVPIFMIISGYVYSFSYRKSSIKKIEDAYHIKGVLHKVIRYTLPFTIVYIIEVIWNAILGRYAGISIVDMIMALTFGFLTGGSGPGSYYYPIMIQFIFIYPIIYFAIKKYAYKGMVICGFTKRL